MVVGAGVLLGHCWLLLFSECSRVHPCWGRCSRPSTSRKSNRSAPHFSLKRTFERRTNGN